MKRNFGVGKSPVKHSGAEYLEETKGWKNQVSAEDHEKYDPHHNKTEDTKEETKDSEATE